jgi:hypothetical protein
VRPVGLLEASKKTNSSMINIPRETKFLVPDIYDRDGRKAHIRKHSVQYMPVRGSIDHTTTTVTTDASLAC